MSETATEVASDIDFDVSTLPKLTEQQAGHIRHFHNIATAQDGEWPHMGTLDPEQGWLDAYRYQLATMAYASGLAHYHRLPAMKSIFASLMRRLIKKMLLPHVWNYWYLTSQSGKRLDADIKELRKPWADPVVRENIMYSGHLLLMVSMYAMLFDEDEFEQEGSLVFEWAPLFWGMGPEKFVYNTQSLQDAILAEIQRENWIGVCCEPNMVFVVCNQFPIIAMRFNDARNGTDIAGEVVAKYWPAIQENRMISEDGLFVDALVVKQSFPRQANSVGFTAWAGTYMNAWNSSWVKGNFDRQVEGYITSFDGQTRVQNPRIAKEFRRLVKDENADPKDPATLDRSRKTINETNSKDSIFQQPLLGYVTEWLSEIGKAQELQSLLDDIDSKHKPCWENGGLRYQRDDRVVDSDGQWIRMEPFSGNAGIAHARLNVPDGMKTMWEKPRRRGHFNLRPYIDGIDLGQGVDCLRGFYNEDRNAMIVTLKALSAQNPVDLSFSVQNLDVGTWKVYKNGKLEHQTTLTTRDSVPLRHGFESGEEVDFVVIRNKS